MGLQPMPYDVLFERPVSRRSWMVPGGAVPLQRASDAAINVHVCGAQLPTDHSTMHLYPIDGARPVFGHLQGVAASTPAKRQLISQWARDYWRACDYSTSTSVNEGEDQE